MCIFGCFCSGWPALQIQLLQELVVAARRMGHSGLATRHMTFLLQTMWNYLSASDQREFAIQLQVINSIFAMFVYVCDKLKKYWTDFDLVFTGMYFRIPCIT